MIPPTFEVWKSLSETKRISITENWSPYDDEIEPILKQITKEFKKEFKHLKGIRNIDGIGDCHGMLALGVDVDFIFDNRKMPQTYLGIAIKTGHIGGLPDDFEVYKNYVWAPENYLNFVENHMDEIRVVLENPNMSKEEMLDALCPLGSTGFQEYIEICRKSKSNLTGL